MGTGLSIAHIAIILFIGVLLFGKRLTEIGRALGKGIVEYRKGLHGLDFRMESDQERADRDSALLNWALLLGFLLVLFASICWVIFQLAA